MYIENTSLTLQFLGFSNNIAPFDYEVSIANSIVTLKWYSALPQPTEQEVLDASNDLTTVNSQLFSEWFAENGGDPVLTNRRLAMEEGIDGDRAISIQSRAELGERNTRDNYLVTRIIELQDALLAIKASTGAADNIRAAIPASFSPSATKDRAVARQDLKDEINSGGSDT